MKLAVKVDSNSGTYQPALGPPPVQLTVQVWVCVPTASGVGPAAAIGAPGVPGTGSGRAERTVRHRSLDICNNRLHAQRNIDLVAAGGGGGGGMSAEFMVMAPMDEGDQVIRVELREAERGRRLWRAEELQLLGEAIATLTGVEKPDGGRYEATGEPPELTLLERGATLVLAGTDVPMRP